MGNIEIYAKEYFEKYSLHKTGKMLNWYHLPVERRREWMDDVYKLMQFLIHELKETINTNTKAISIQNTSYAKGREEGIFLERLRYKTALDDMEKSMFAEVQEYNN